MGFDAMHLRACPWYSAAKRRLPVLLVAVAFVTVCGAIPSGQTLARGLAQPIPVVVVAVVGWMAGWAWAGFVAVWSVAAEWVFVTKETASWKLVASGLLPLASRLIELGIVGWLAHAAASAKRAQWALRRQDPLTGLCNARSFLEELQRVWQNGIDGNKPVTVLFLDGDDFKSINDTKGHLAGDTVLMRTAEVLRSTLRPNDVIARLGGDEFAVLCPHMGCEQARVQAMAVRDRLLQELAEVDGPMTFSIGVATFLDRPPRPTDMLRAADDAMYQVKRAGKNGLHFVVVDPV